MQIRTTAFINHPDSPIHEVIGWLNGQFRDKSYQEALHFLEEMKKHFPELRWYMNQKNTQLKNMGFPVRENRHQNTRPAKNHLRVIK